MNQSQHETLETHQGTRIFQDLMRNRVREILLVSSLYDSFILSEDGSLYESLLNEYIGLGLTHMPNIIRVTSGTEGVRLAREPNRFDLIICSLHLADLHAVEFANRVKEIGIDTPVILLTYDNRELNELISNGGGAKFDKVFIWQGDFRVLLSIIKFIEDRLNIQRDTELVGVQTIILIEDNVKFYSSYLPLIYTAVLEHTEDLIAEGVNPAHKLLRMRARPKILLCDNYEEAWKYFETYHETILGVVSDIEFPRDGKPDTEAGFHIAREILKSHDDIPVLLQSRDVSSRSRAEELGASFLQKDSPTLLHELKQFMIHHFGFGDFIFRLRDGTVVGRANDLRSLEEQLYVVPDESIAYHGERNHFSTWLKARTEFVLAHKLRPVLVSDYNSISEVREHLIKSLREQRQEQQRGSIVDFDPDTFDDTRSFARVGGGSLGGKARGLGFANALIKAAGLEDGVPGVRIVVPPSIVLGSNVFDEFMDDNDLWDFAIHTGDDEEIAQRFQDSEFPDIVAEALSSFLHTVRVPLSVRSSSLLEDSQFMPFAGIYETYMLPNNHRDPHVRLEELLNAVKRVYASTFFASAKRYIKSTPYRLEEEKMPVIIQKLVGSTHEDRFYPDFSGVVRSHNFYPIKPMEASDGIASVALGLGKQVVEGGATVRFCPRYPRHLVQMSQVDEVLRHSQKSFYALEMPDPGADGGARRCFRLVQAQLADAERDGTLGAVGSTYSLDNHAIYDGVSRDGSRVVTFAPILKNDLFPLPEVLIKLLEVGTTGMSGPVEVEFAVTLSRDSLSPDEFHLLQLRPMVIDQELERLTVLEAHRDEMICRSTWVLGNGAVNDIHDIVLVDIDRFNRAESVRVAREVGRVNRELVDTETPYVLIGVGRWGSADPWLGIPVRWDDICGARVIVESGMKDIKVTPSQGTHFFQNITALRIGYLTVDSNARDSFIDWEWLAEQPAEHEESVVRHLRFDRPLRVIMDGSHNRAVILKPEPEADTQ